MSGRQASPKGRPHFSPTPSPAVGEFGDGDRIRGIEEIGDGDRITQTVKPSVSNPKNSVSVPEFNVSMVALVTYR